jgi:hypothetical protein
MVLGFCNRLVNEVLAVGDQQIIVGVSINQCSVAAAGGPADVKVTVAPQAVQNLPPSAIGYPHWPQKHIKNHLSPNDA